MEESDKQAYCVLVTKDEIVQYNIQLRLDLEYLSSSMIEKYKSAIRLQTMVKTNNGFEIAETDLKLRGPGDIFSTKQSGFPDLKYADIVRDVELISLAKNIAFDLINKDPSLSSESSVVIRKNLIKHYSDNLQYAKIA
ncbi:MAG: hypothetical protein U5J96_04360 [Ignavibacteriaceae bacterium]|nr:hypothetical protein [Ignavibacteriaceae bacterium]